MMGQPVELNMIIAMAAMPLLFCRDRKMVHIYHPRPYPHNQYYIKGGPISLGDSKNVVTPTRLLINL